MWVMCNSLKRKNKEGSGLGLHVGGKRLSKQSNSGSCSQVIRSLSLRLTGVWCAFSCTTGMEMGRLVKGRLSWKSKPLVHYSIYIPTLTNGALWSYLKGDITDARVRTFCKNQLKEEANILIFARCPCDLIPDKQQIIHGWIIHDISYGHIAGIILVVMSCWR